MPSVTPEQADVIGHQYGPALVLSVAGSGKTRTLLMRTARLIEEGADPNSILLATFTRLGAADMQRRGVELGIPEKTRFRTLHSVVWGIVKPLRPTWELPPEWWVREVLSGAAEGWMRAEEGVASDVDMSVPMKQIQGLIGRAKADLVGPDALEHASGTRPSFLEWVSKIKGVDKKTARMVDYCYRALEQARADPYTDSRGRAAFKSADAVGCSHDDVMYEFGRSVLCKDELSRGSRGMYEYMMVDECQDNTLAQWALVDWLARRDTRTDPRTGRVTDGKNIMVVGDDSQAIFQWRGARPDLLSNFVEKGGIDLSVYALSSNFRSGQKIIDVANAILGHVKGRLFQGKLVCARTDIDAKVDVRDFPGPQEEAADVAWQIQKALEEGVPASEIAVLYRVNACAGAVELELMKRKIPCRVAGRSFFTRPDINAIVKWITVALNPTDQDAWQVVYRTPNRYIKRTILQKYPSFASVLKERPGVLHADARGLTRIVDDVKKLQRSLERGGVALAIKTAWLYNGIREHFAARAGGDADATGMDQAVEALEACALSCADVHEFLRMASGDAKTLQEDPDGEKVKDRVTLSSGHSAKGLEFQRVFVIAVNNGVFPLDTTDMDEERRLFYVAVTRAKQNLCVSYTTGSGDGSKGSDPSEFLFESGLLGRSAQRETMDRELVGGAPIEGGELQAGDRVVHDTFGAGLVKSVFEKGAKAEIKFLYGPKVIVLRYAKMRVTHRAASGALRGT